MAFTRDMMETMVAWCRDSARDRLHFLGVPGSVKANASHTAARGMSYSSAMVSALIPISYSPGMV